jgi:hypothetical protein
MTCPPFKAFPLSGRGTGLRPETGRQQATLVDPGQPGRTLAKINYFGFRPQRTARLEQSQQLLGVKILLHFTVHFPYCSKYQRYWI